MVSELELYKLFAKYLLEELAPDLNEVDMEYTAGDVIEAGLTINKLITLIEEGVKENA